MFEERKQKVWGHSATRMLQALQEDGDKIPADLIDTAKTLDKHYIPTRYPNGLEQGAPTEFYLGHRVSFDPDLFTAEVESISKFNTVYYYLR